MAFSVTLLLLETGSLDLNEDKIIIKKQKTKKKFGAGVFQNKKEERKKKRKVRKVRKHLLVKSNNSVVFEGEANLIFDLKLICLLSSGQVIY